MAQLFYMYDKAICNFTEMEGYYVEKTWFVFELHSRNTFHKGNVCKEGGVQNKTRAVSEPPKRKSKKRKIQGS